RQHPLVGPLIAAFGYRGVDLAAAFAPVDDHENADHGEEHADGAVELLRAAGDRRHQTARADAHGEGGEPRSPPRQVRALVRESCASSRIAVLIEATAAGRLVVAADPD